MKKGKTIFLIVYLLFHLALLIAAIVINLRAEDFKFLFSIRENMATTVWFAVVGMILFIINAVIISISTRNHEKKEEQLKQEINTLKAKMYDLQDTRPSRPTTPLPSSNEGLSSKNKDQKK